ncbi:MAG: hypothetical protein E7Z93_05205 [Cyanobacteria bacterium SIG32]|nr:hypothetical protein [Cyanobacteria bacterium SIG32]
MGMAASQARLLSITSRIADNELRAQIVNNSKMRLATESSKVSEQYVSALNDATMMMSNYDLDGNSQTQKLTFNALTSYSAHNNQYGLINTSGKLLVTEAEADIYKTADGDLNQYLAAHGLAYTSTYFTEETLGANNVNIKGYNEITRSEYDIGTYTVNELKAMYEGLACGNTAHKVGVDEEGHTIYHMGYNASLQSFEYANYTDYYSQFEIADMAYDAAVLKEIKSDETDIKWSELETHKSNVSNAAEGDYTTLKNALTFVRGRHTALTSTTPDKKLDPNSEYAKSIDALLKGYSSATNPPTITITTTLDSLGSGKYGIGKREDGSYALTLTNTSGSTYTITGSNATIAQEQEVDNGDGTFSTQTIDVNYTSTSNSGTSATIGSGTSIRYTESVSGTGVTPTSTQYTLTNFDFANNKVTSKYSANFEEARAYVLAVLEQYGNIAGFVNRDAYAETGEALAAKAEYDKAYETLVDFIFGTGNRPTGADGTTIEGNEKFLNDPGWIISKFGDKTSEAFQVIEDIYILDQLFNVYGEPNWGWIDENNPSENADAKVKWYTNLFERMKQGFTVIENGLASSNKWIQFALESGIVTMEQVDTNNNWTSMLHSNCSDITEVTDEKAVAKAEAEYNKAMTNIENKDKRFDIELKNIDTEHNSLQTEYDSIKSVISKNIERSFKMYQA